MTGDSFFMDFFCWFAKMPKEYRKRHLKRLERRIRNQRLEIKIMCEQLENSIKFQSYYQIRQHDLERKLRQEINKLKENDK